VEVQGTGEEATFSDKELQSLLKLAKKGIAELTDIQSRSLGRKWPFA
jgi:ribonuclease PH